MRLPNTKAFRTAAASIRSRGVVMLVAIELCSEALADGRSLRTLATKAAHHELVLVCTCAAATDVIRFLRIAIPRHHVVALVIDDVPSRTERALLQEFIEEGRVPLIVTTEGRLPHQSEDWRWLGVDVCLSLPDNGHQTLPGRGNHHA
jgi:hypothetical protein